MITSVSQAITLLDHPGADPVQREMAAHYLEQHADVTIAHRLVQALQDDDPGVRWAAAEALARLGDTALPELLVALMNPKQVGDPLMREGIYRVLYHNRSREVTEKALHLMHALHGPAADLASMEEAYLLLRAMAQQKLAQQKT